MYLKHKSNGDLVEVLDMGAMINPMTDKVVGRFHSGEEMQEPETFDKQDLGFPSGEPLPKCWVDKDYRG